MSAAFVASCTAAAMLVGHSGVLAVKDFPTGGISTSKHCSAARKISALPLNIGRNEAAGRALDTSAACTS